MQHRRSTLLGGENNNAEAAVLERDANLQRRRQILSANAIPTSSARTKRLWSPRATSRISRSYASGRFLASSLKLQTTARELFEVDCQHLYWDCSECDQSRKRRLRHRLA